VIEGVRKGGDDASGNEDIASPKEFQGVPEYRPSSMTEGRPVRRFRDGNTSVISDRLLAIVSSPVGFEHRGLTESVNPSRTGLSAL
jgi:hypothetical protein